MISIIALGFTCAIALLGGDCINGPNTNGTTNGKTSDTINGIANGNGHHQNSNASTHQNGLNGHQNGHLNGASPQPAAFQTPPEVPIAICGMGMRLPGGIRNDADLYDFLINKKDARGPTPKERFNIDSYYNAHDKPGTIITKHGYYLEDVDLADFDVSMFGMTQAEVTRLDPNQRLLLEVVREAFESAGEGGFRGKDIGSFVGVFTEDWQDLQNKDVGDFAPYQVIGKMDFVLGNRIAYEYDLRGPSMTIKTACSAAALGVHEALQSIRQGECSAAIAGGVNLILAPGLSIGMTAQATLSPEGSSKTFDAAADGYARGEAVSAIYVKRLDLAIRDGNPIRAVIRASATNADGRTSGIAMPSPDAHEALIRQTYKTAGLDFADTAMVECHGTGTAVGDPLEVEAVANCFGKDGVYIGSVKPNLGHGEGASAITSIAKAVLALENKTIIPNIKFVTPHPGIPWEAAKLKVPTDPMRWPSGRHERMSVNSFGIGGSNVHFILDSAASFGLGTSQSIPRGPSSPVSQEEKKSLLVFSAGSNTSLERIADDHEKYLQVHGEDALEDMSYTLIERREHLKLRSFCVTDGSSPFKLAPATKPSATSSDVAFVFTGQGAQWVHMGRELMREYPSFRESMRSMDRHLQTLKHAPTWTMHDILEEVEDPVVIHSPEYSLPICTALQVALVDLLATWGVRPAAVVGHSGGETAAAYACGGMTANEAVTVGFYRGYVLAQSKRPGSMAAIGLGREQATPYLVPGVQIACENSDSSVTLSGDIGRLEKVMAAIKRDFPDVLNRKLQVQMAYHSYHMLDVGDAYYNLLTSHLECATADIPFYSSVTLDILREGASFGAKYWQDNLEKPVLFGPAVHKLVSERPDITTHIEIGPHSALAGPLRQIYKTAGANIQYFSALIRGKNDVDSFLSCIGQLHCSGVKVQFPASNNNVLTDLPTYPWHYDKKYWAETRVMTKWRFMEHRAHDLLGQRALESSDKQPVWRNKLRVIDVPWLRDHCVGNDIIFPAAGYMSMAGEAVLQCTGSNDYTLRDVNFATALVLHEESPTELITAFRRKRLTATLESDWYEFSISSYGDSATWTQHCWGLVRAGRASAPPGHEVVDLSKAISAKRWYKAMSRIGLNYGPRFTGLKDITASAGERRAAMRVTDVQDDVESPYPLHPATLDIILQAWTIASTKGEYRTFNKLFLPTFIEEIYVSSAASKTLHVNTAATGAAGTAHGSSYGVADGEVVFFLKGFKGTPVEDVGIEKPPEMTGLHLQWKPDVEFMEASALMKPKFEITPQLVFLERLYILCAAEAKQTLATATASQPHFEKFRSWIDEQFERWMQPGYPLVEDSVDLVNMEKEDRDRMIAEIRAQAQDTSGWPMAEAIWRSYDRVLDVFEGRMDFLDLLLQDGLLPQIYNWMNELWDIGPFFRLLGHTQSQLRILEIGAGTGGLTSKILEGLVADAGFGERLYLEYTYTDVSSGFFVQSKERFKDYENIEYRVLDIAKDPLEQGFDAGEYDLIVASNVIHATPFLTETLKNCQTLLRPDGRLFLQELSPIVRCMGFIMGQFSGWWLGEADGRFGGPFVSPEEWEVKLREAGFAGIESMAFDNERPYHMNASIIARPAYNPQVPARVTLLMPPSKRANSALADSTHKLLRETGYETDVRVLGEELPANQDVISFIDVDSPDGPLLKDITSEDLEKFLGLVDSSLQSLLLWLTPPAQINCQDPHAAQILGAARTIRQELAMDFATLELDDTGPGAAEAIVKVLRKIQRARKTEDGTLNPDLEYAWSNGAIQLPRFHWFPIQGALTETAQKPDAKGLIAGQRGMLQSLHWRAMAFHDLGPHEVQVRMKVVGMNFTDVVIALGIINSSEILGEGFNALGLEGTGHVTKIGAAVDHVAPGDRVLVIGTNSTGFATEVQRPAEFCCKIPEDLSSEDAATMPAVYITVLRCFLDKAQLQRGQSVLIHSAGGGVGIAAIYVAKWLGAEIYVTVGSEEKASYITKEFGIPRSRIFNSRSTEFLDDVMRATNGVGVDAVLNSVSGDVLHASWKCVSVNGCMLEIGKRDMIGKGQLAMDLFEENRTFFGIDLSRLTVVDKPTVARLLAQTVDLYKQGHIKPIHPLNLFEARDVEDAFRYMQKGVHMGKIVVRFPDEDNLPLTASVPNPIFRNDKSYLLVGGLGGLGKSVASWMVSSGAKHLIFLSRSAGESEEDQAFFAQLNEAGCATQYHAGDVADRDLVQTVVQSATQPIAGAMQIAMVLRDIGIMDMDLPTWSAATRPKISGTWVLHELLPHDLDFLVLFGSHAGTLGYYGQSNYASANTFLDGFVQYRRSLGLAASVMDIGAVDDVGFVARTQSVLDTLANTSGRMLTEQDFLDCLQLAIARSPVLQQHAPASSLEGGYCNRSQITQVLECSLPITDPNNNIIWKRDPRMAIYRNIERATTSHEGSGSDSLRPFMTSLMQDPQRFDDQDTAAFLAQQVAARVSAFLMRGDENGVGLDQTLSEVGVDSLVAIEVRNWWKTNFGVDVSVLELMNGGTIGRLGGLAAARLKEKYVGKEA
ncbi:putative polyketide synthase [Astrocystis sublimbata]|nr:putative polyketide synthase [Astrocystis sublimbata]